AAMRPSGSLFSGFIAARYRGRLGVMIGYALLLLLLAVCIGLPLYYAWRVFGLDEASRGGWLVRAAEAVLLVTLIFLVGRWDIAGLYTRWLLVALLAAAIAFSWRRHAGRPWRAEAGPPFWKSHLSPLAG